MMLHSVDTRTEDRTFSTLNFVRAENQDIQASFAAVTQDIFEDIDNEQTFRKEIYSENNEESEYVIDNQSYFPTNININNGCQPVVPRQAEECWNIKLLLVKLSKQITDDDLEIIKFLLTDFGEGELRHASTLKVFDVLHSKRFITSKDLLYLQVILAVIGKLPLIDVVYKYAQNSGNVLHFDPPLKTTVCGYHTFSVRGADFASYSASELDHFCDRIMGIVSISPNSINTSTRCANLCCSEGSYDSRRNHGDNESSHQTHVKYFRSFHYVVFSDIGMQTEVMTIDGIDPEYCQALEEENSRLRSNLAEEKLRAHLQAKKVSEMKKRIRKFEKRDDIHDRQFSDIPESIADSEIEDVNSFIIYKEDKDKDFELQSLKKDNAVLNLATLALSEKSESLQSKYEDVQSKNECLQSKYESLQSKYESLQSKYESLQSTNESLQSKSESLQSKYEDVQSKYVQAKRDLNELQIEKTNTEIQMSLLQKNIDNLEAKLKACIEEENSLITQLRNELEMTTASLLNAQNDKRLFELTRCLEQIASMSMTVKKVYGNFDPAHDHISPKQDELFRKSLTGKIGRIFPQIYYTTSKR